MTSLKQRERKRRELETVPADLIFEQTGGLCTYCNFEVYPEKSWVRVGEGAWENNRLLWSEVELAHLVCYQHERHFRKSPGGQEKES